MNSKKKKQEVTLFDILLLYVFAGVFFGFGEANNSHIRWFRDHGIIAEGLVVDAYSTRNYLTTYIVEYTTQGGATVKAEISGAGGVGKKVIFWYNPNDPSDVMRLDAKEDYLGYVCAGLFALMAFAGLIAKILDWRTAWKIRHS